LAVQRQLGLSHFVSVGNKADVSGNDLMQYWEQDAGTDIILLYLESFGNPRRFSRIARRVSRSKPILAVKGGRTGAGTRAAGSHTAALAGNDVAVDALFRQTGVIRVDTLEHLFDAAALLSTQPVPEGKRVAIVTNAGGPGILCSDACETGGLEVVEFSEPLRKQLAGFLPAAASLANPVDMIASAPPEHYRQTIAAVLASNEIDSLIVLYIPVGTTHLAGFIEGIRAGIQEGRAAGGAGKPVLTCMMGGQEPLPMIAAGSERVPNYAFPESAGRVLARAAGYGQWRSQRQGVFVDFEGAQADQARAICREALQRRGAGWLTTAEAREVLIAMGLPVSAGAIATTAQEAAVAAERMGFPVAVKLASHQILHKTEHQAVYLGLKDGPSVKRAFEEMRLRLEQAGQLDAMEGALVQPMVSSGVEVMVGVVEDPSFGPLIAFGLGGIHVEVLRDVSFRVTPLTDEDAKEMVREIKGFRLLEGYRGHAPADIPAIEELLLRVSLLVEEVPEIAELDLNPVFACEPGQGCRIVDARIRVQPVADHRPERSLQAPIAARPRRSVENSDVRAL
jgi:acyl-CoA synthetase (NDP forming)